MIDERVFRVMWRYGYSTKEEAYEVVRNGFMDVKGVTVVKDHEDGLFYIVQSIPIAEA